jgi:hypothetical protein
VRLTYKDLTRQHTYELVVNSGQYVGSRNRTLILSVEVLDSTNAACRERKGATPGARGKVVLVERLDGGAIATVELPCNVDEKWESKDDRVGLDVRFTPCPERTTKSVAAKCVSPPAPVGSFALVSAKVAENPNVREVTVSPSESATWDHCCDGGKWKMQYTWKFPASLTPGKSFSISMSLKTVSVEPSQRLGGQMTALAPDFRQDLTTSYPAQPSASKTYAVPFSAGYKDPSYKELKLYVGFASASVVFTYRRVS